MSLAHLATGALLAQVTDGTASSGAETVLFWVFAAIAIGAGFAVVSLRNIVHAALMLVLNFLSIAALYLGLQSSFLSIVQVIVYAGAIVVLFLFVIMLLGVDRDDLLGVTSPVRAVGAVVAGVALAGALLVVVGSGSLTDASACGAQAGEAVAGAVECVGLDAAADDSVTFVGARLFTRWTFPFEAASLLLVVATLGALVLGRRKDPAIEDGLAPSAPVPGAADLDEVRDRLGDADPQDSAGDLVAAELRTVSDATARLVDADDSDALAAPDNPDPSEDPAAGLADGDTTDEDS